MGLFDWFKRAATDDPAAAEKTIQPLDEADSSTVEIDGLNFFKAIEAHQRWKVRLSTYIRGESTEKLDAAVVGKDNQCDLGRWLHSAARVPQSELPLLSRLIDEHAEFHRRAAEVVRLTDDGRLDEASSLVVNGAYARASHKVTHSLSQLFLALSEFHRPGSTS